jgi:Pvc16 N-terminal domain
MLDDLDKTLEKLLQQELPSALAERISISFATPDQEFPTKVQLPAINLFLYDVRENLELRNTEWLVERHSNGTATRKRPPVRVDCSYFISSWPVDRVDAQTEHRLLGEVMKVLLRYPQIPAEFLQGTLQGQQPPLRVESLRPSQLQSMGEFWQAMGGKPRAILNYTVTLSVDVQEFSETVPLVMDKNI